MSHADSHPPGRPPGFLYHPGRDFQQLQCEARPLSALGKRFGTPLYIYSAKTIRRRLRDFDQAFGDYPHTICYSVKANSNIHILRLLAKMGCGFDVVSGGELERVLRADRRAARSVVFSGVGKTPDEMRAALNAGILLFNVESESELEVLAACAARLHKPARMALRVNPDVPAETHPYISTGLHQHKFGVPIRQAPELYHRAAKSKFLRAAGVSVHIGSQITDVSPFRASMERVANLVLGLRRAGHDIRYVDAGGGLGIAYKDQSPPDFSARVRFYADALLGPLRNLDIQLLLEPGRSIVGPAGVLLTRVLYKKTNNARTFVVVDAAMNDLLRPALYQAYHEIVPVKTGHSYEEVVDVVGPVCETGDFFARDRKLGLVNQGDLLAILDAGAYGMSLASNYNTRPRAAEILVDGKRARLIRKRESTEYLLRLE
ncbi:MAG TPA: diaminopimelate decarboxylase [Terriglobales bacterium]